MQSTKAINIPKLIAWLVLLLAVVEWLPFFLQVMLNFFNMNLRDFPAEDIVLVLAPVLSPLVTLFFSLAGWKKPATMKRVSTVLGIASIVVVAAMNWLAYSAYYQYYGIFAPDLSTVGATGGAFGILAYLTPLVKPMLYWTNALTFLLAVPALFTAATDGTGRLQYSHELNLGALFTGLYMAFRPGSIVDTPLRLVIVSLAAGAIWLLAEVNAHGNEDSRGREHPYLIDSSAIPKWSEEGLAILLAIVLVNPSMSAMGMLNTTWVWAFLAAGAGVAEIAILSKKRISSKVPGVAVFGALVAVEAVVIWADVNARLLSIEPWLHGTALFLLSLLFPACLPLFSKKRDNVYLTHPGRQFIFNLIGVVSFLLPLLIIATLPPISTLAGVLIIGTGGGLSLLSILVAHKKDR